MSPPLPSLAPSRPSPLQSSRRGGGEALYRWVIPSPNPANRSADKQNQEMREKEHSPPHLLLLLLLLVLLLPRPRPLVPLGWSSRKSHSGMAPRTFRKEEKKREGGREREVSQCYSNAINKKRKNLIHRFLKNRPKAKTRKLKEKRGGGTRGGTVRQNPARNLGQLHRTVLWPLAK